jgi:hypothetical protein
MALRLQVFRSTVARRVFGLFVLAALIPVTATAMLALNHVSRVLTEIAEQQLRDASRSYGQLVFQRLVTADRALSRLSANPVPVVSADSRPSELEAAAVLSGG